MVAGGLEEIREGAARILVPSVRRLKGPGRKGPHAFYNPAMVVARDLTVAAIAASTGDGDRVLDGMCGTGAMGIRAYLETRHDLALTLSDRHAGSVELAGRNLELNAVEAADVVRSDVNAVVSERRFEYVDIDPFGSPVPYLDSVLRESRDRQVVSVTATDLAVLCGARPKACLRRYGARPVRTPFGHEMAVRVLMGHCARTAAKHDVSVEPLLSAHAEHFVKVWLSLRRGAGRADRSLALVSSFRYDPATGRREFTDDRRGGGPIWSGDLIQEAFLDRLRATEWTSPPSARIVDLLREEVGAHPLHHTTDEWAKRLRLSPPRLNRLLGELRDAGFRAAPTHYHPRGFRTDAPVEDIEVAFRRAAPD